MADRQPLKIGSLPVTVAVVALIAIAAVLYFLTMNGQQDPGSEEAVSEVQTPEPSSGGEVEETSVVEEQAGSGPETGDPASVASAEQEQQPTAGAEQKPAELASEESAGSAAETAGTPSQQPSEAAEISGDATGPVENEPDAAETAGTELASQPEGGLQAEEQQAAVDESPSVSVEAVPSTAPQEQGAELSAPQNGQSASSTAPDETASGSAQEEVPGTGPTSELTTAVTEESATDADTSTQAASQVEPTALLEEQEEAEPTTVGASETSSQVTQPGSAQTTSADESPTAGEVLPGQEDGNEAGGGDTAIVTSQPDGSELLEQPQQVEVDLAGQCPSESGLDSAGTGAASCPEQEPGSSVSADQQVEAVTSLQVDGETAAVGEGSSTAPPDGQRDGEAAPAAVAQSIPEADDEGVENTVAAPETPAADPSEDNASVTGDSNQASQETAATSGAQLESKTVTVVEEDADPAIRADGADSLASAPEDPADQTAEELLIVIDDNLSEGISNETGIPVQATTITRSTETLVQGQGQAEESGADQQTASLGSTGGASSQEPSSSAQAASRSDQGADEIGSGSPESGTALAGNQATEVPGSVESDDAGPIPEPEPSGDNRLSSLQEDPFASPASNEQLAKIGVVPAPGTDTDTTPSEGVAADQEQPEPAISAPTFDIVRVDRFGTSIVAGRAPAGSIVEAIVNEETAASGRTGRNGQFAMVFSVDTTQESLAISLRSTLPDNSVLISQETVFVVPPRGRTADLQPLPGAEIPDPVASPAAIPEIQLPDPAELQPSVLLATEDGIRLIQPSLPDEEKRLLVEVVSYDEFGQVFLAGNTRSEAGHINFYLDDALAKTIEITGEGSWWTDLAEIEPGRYRLRVEEVDMSNRVVASVEMPFQKESPEHAREMLRIASLPNEAELEPSDGGPGISLLAVQRGFTLWGISREQYGLGRLYVNIFNANRDQIEDPDLIFPGQIFVIPDDSNLIDPLW